VIKSSVISPMRSGSQTFFLKIPEGFWIELSVHVRRRRGTWVASFRPAIVVN
jgi:hypothetical protein